ncbi:uncharacterized protein [Dermacentor albipictus]|uniref:uncharacterized protein n=1 Tax=Dermacentor albipictus TaxID=60249 RepID=UPI0038FCB356
MIGKKIQTENDFVRAMLDDGEENDGVSLSNGPPGLRNPHLQVRFTWPSVRLRDREHLGSLHGTRPRNGLLQPRTRIYVRGSGERASVVETRSASGRCLARGLRSACRHLGTRFYARGSGDRATEWPVLVYGAVGRPPFPAPCCCVCYSTPVITRPTSVSPQGLYVSPHCGLNRNLLVPGLLLRASPSFEPPGQVGTTCVVNATTINLQRDSVLHHSSSTCADAGSRGCAHHMCPAPPLNPPIKDHLKQGRAIEHGGTYGMRSANNALIFILQHQVRGQYSSVLEETVGEEGRQRDDDSTPVTSRPPGKRLLQKGPRFHRGITWQQQGQPDETM